MEEWRAQVARLAQSPDRASLIWKSCMDANFPLARALWETDRDSALWNRIIRYAMRGAFVRVLSDAMTNHHRQMLAICLRWPAADDPIVLDIGIRRECVEWSTSNLTFRDSVMRVPVVVVLPWLHTSDLPETELYYWFLRSAVEAGCDNIRLKRGLWPKVDEVLQNEQQRQDVQAIRLSRWLPLDCCRHISTWV